MYSAMETTATGNENRTSIKKLGTLCYVASIGAALALVTSGEFRIYAETRMSDQLLQQIPLIKKQMESLQKIIKPITAIVSDTKGFVDPIAQKVGSLNETIQKTRTSVDKLKALADGASKLPFIGESVKSFADSIDQWTRVVEETGSTIQKIANNSSESLSSTREMLAMYATEIIPQTIAQVDQIEKTVKIVNLANQVVSRIAYWLTGLFFVVLGTAVKRVAFEIPRKV